IPRRSLSPLAIAGAFDDEYRRSRPRPDLSHVVQLALRLRVVLAGHDDDCRERQRRFVWKVKIGRHPVLGTDLEDDILEPVTLSGMPRRHLRLKRRLLRRELAHRLLEGSYPLVAESLPL